MKIENGNFCPLIKKDCVGLKCTWFVQLRGTNPQTGEPVDEWDCAVKWLPMLLIENAKEVRQGAAATESFRNEMVKASWMNIDTMVKLASGQPVNEVRMIDASPNNNKT